MATSNPKRPRLDTCTGLCYYVNIDCPFVCTTKDEAEDKLEWYKRLKGEVPQGTWILARMVDPVYYYKFLSSRAAKKSKSVDFIVVALPVDTNKILPRAQKGYVAIQLKLYTESQLQDHCCKSVLSVVQGLLAQQSAPDQIGQVLLQLQKELKDTAQGAIPNLSLPPYPQPYNYPATALNVVFKNTITEFCEQNGYKVYSDRSRIIEFNNPQASRYFASRPDLVLCNPCKLHGVICVLIEEEGEVEGEQEPGPEQALIGAISENKHARDVLGQLLGGMEKIAGDLAYEYIRSSAKFQQFNKIQLTGLVMDYSEDECEVYELTMDFEENLSTLYSGQQKLCISDAANRLISKLESAQKNEHKP